MKEKKQYNPELGQYLFGQTPQAYEPSDFLESALTLISHAWSEATGEGWNSPFGNYGSKWKCDTFEVEAYSWNEEYDQPYNFKWRDIEISWYKYLGRGMSVNREVSFEEVTQMVKECLDDLAKYKESNGKQ